MAIFEFLPGFISLIILAAIIAVIVVGIRRRDADEPGADPGIGTVRRLYFYIVSLTALIMASLGVAFIIQYVLEELFGGIVVSPSANRLAAGIALTLVGLPLWVLHWIWTQRYVAQMPVERRSILRKLYIYLALGIAGGILIGGVFNIFQWAFGADEFGGFPWGAVIVFGAVWVFYWRVESAEGQPTAETLGIRRLYLYIASLVTLSMTAIGAGRIIFMLLLAGYDALFVDVILSPEETDIWRPALQDMLALVIAGAPAWAVHWLYFARRDYGSFLRQLYLYIFAILGGAVTTLVSLGVIIFVIISWLIGAPSPDETEVFRFRSLTGAAASLSIGLALWLYHWGVVQAETRFSEDEARVARRSYSHIMAALGLIALGVGAGIVVHTALAVITEAAGDTIIRGDLWRGPIAAAITLGILGGPIWGWYWVRIQRETAERGAEERTSLPRRIFIFALLGVGVLTILGSSSTLLFIILRDFLDTGVTLDTARSIRTPLSIIVAVLIFLPYYWRVYQRDREAEPRDTAAVERRARKEVSVLVNPGGDDFVRVLESALGYRVSPLRWADPGAVLPTLSQDQAQDVAQRVSAAPGPRVLVVADGADVRVLSYN